MYISALVYLCVHMCICDHVQINLTIYDLPTLGEDVLPGVTAMWSGEAGLGSLRRFWSGGGGAGINRNKPD